MTNLHKVRIPNAAGIYIIRNFINDNVYIGQSACLSKRVRGHIYKLRIGAHGNIKLQRFVNKYGLAVIEFDVLEITPKDKMILCEREQFHMNNHKIKFNIAKSAYSTLGVKKTADERRRMSEKRKGLKQSPEQIEAAAAPKRGKKRHPFTEETKRKMSENAKKRYANGDNPFKGRKHTPENIERLRQIALNRPPVSDEFRMKMSAVTSGEKNGMYGRKHSEETKEKIRQKRLERNRRLAA